jgi:hypothetical protein
MFYYTGNDAVVPEYYRSFAKYGGVVVCPYACVGKSWIYMSLMTIYSDWGVL